MGLTFAGWPASTEVLDARSLVVPDPAPLVDPVELVDQLPAGDQVVVAWSPGLAGGVHALRVARALSMRTDVALVAVEGSATQVEALRATTEIWPRDVPPVAIRELAAHVLGSDRTVTVVSSVARLREPAPTVVQHALSALPWTRFTVDHDFDRVQLGGQPPRRAHGLLGPVVAAVSDPASTPLLEPLTEWSGPAARVVSPPPGAGPAARRWAEVTVLPDTGGRLLTRWAAALVVRPCPACERAVSGPGCLFCGAAQPDEPAQRTAPEPTERPGPAERPEPTERPTDLTVTSTELEEAQ